MMHKSVVPDDRLRRSPQHFLVSSLCSRVDILPPPMLEVYAVNSMLLAYETMPMHVEEPARADPSLSAYLSSRERYRHPGLNSCRYAGSVVTVAMSNAVGGRQPLMCALPPSS
jgi:hypothetical protein